MGGDFQAGGDFGGDDMSLADYLLSDLDTIINADDFGSTVTYINSAGVSASIVGIWEAGYQSFNPYDGVVTIETSNPQLTVKTASVSAAKPKEIILRSGIRYEIKSVRPDGTGVTVLELTKEI